MLDSLLDLWIQIGSHKNLMVDLPIQDGSDNSRNLLATAL